MKGKVFLFSAILLALIALLAQFFPFDKTPPAVKIQPAPGNYNEIIDVSITSEKGAKIFYALGEGEPLPYLSPIQLKRDTSISYYAKDWSGNRSESQIAEYKVRLDNAPPATTASPGGGKYFHPVSVRLKSEKGAVIRYSTDKSVPGSSSSVYSSAIVLRKDTILKFFATDEVGNIEKTRTVKYRIQIDNTKPVTLADPSGGVFNQPITVALLAEENSVIYYTLDGSRPTSRSSRYSDPVAFSRSGVLRFFAVDEAGNSEKVREEQYVIDTAPPVVNAEPAAGTFGKTQMVQLKLNERGEIRYETEGRDAGTDSRLYSGPVSISETTDLSYVGIDKAGNISESVHAMYIIDTIPPETTARPPGGKYSGRIRVKLESSESADIYYTLDGTSPDSSSAPYRGPINISSNLVLSFLAVDKVGNRSAVASQKYILDQTPPKATAEPAGGSYSGPLSVTLKTEKGAVIRFTTDGTSPGAASPVYSRPVKINRDTMLKFYATDISGNKEEIRVEKYVFDTTPPSTIVEPAPGTFNRPVSVSLRLEKEGQVFIRKDTQRDFALYSGPFVFNKSGKVYFYSIDQTGNKEAVQMAEYIIDNKMPITIPYPAPGEYNPPITLEFKTEEGAKVHYTLDGSQPSESSPLYTSPLSLKDPVTVKYFAIDRAGNVEKVKSASYSVTSGLWRDNTSGVFIHPSVIDGEYLWVGGEEGLFRVGISDKRRKNFTKSSGLISNSVYGIAVDRLGFKWIGTKKGVSQFDGNRNWVTYDYSDGLPSNHINCVVIDPLDNIWFGTDKGLSLFDRKTFKTLTTSDGLPDNNVNAMAIDSNGVFWIGTDKGLVRRHGKETRVFTTADGLPGDEILSVAVDGRWNIWVGTNGQGIARYDGSRWVRYGSAEGMQGRIIDVIAVDLTDKKWFGTDSGVYKYGGTGFESVGMAVYR